MKPARPETTPRARALTGGRRCAARKRRAFIAAAGLLAILSGSLANSPVAGQTTDTAEVRIVARQLVNGDVEFGLQQLVNEDSWGFHHLPRLRFVPSTVEVERWLQSSPLGLTVGGVRIVARKHADGKIEFGLQQRHTDGTWGIRQMPRVRFFPTDAPVGSWLQSSRLILSRPQSASRESSDVAGSGDSPGKTPAPTFTTPRVPATYTRVSAGGSHTCAVSTEATIVCWGNDENGQSSPPGGTFESVSAGHHHSCGVRTDGTVTCWGRDGEGQATPPGGRFEAVAAGGLHTCGVRTDGTMTCWGDNKHGQTSAPDGEFRAVTAGYIHSCGVRADDTVACWSGGSRANPPDGEFRAVSAGDAHTCGVRKDRTVACWGHSDNGQAEAADGEFSAVAAGGHHSCGLRRNLTVVCWGEPWQGQTTPPYGTVFRDITAGKRHSCGILPGGTISCWGDNTFGQRNAPGA